MLADQLSSDEVKAEMMRDLDAFARIEARFPGYKIVLVPKDNADSQTTPDAAGAPAVDSRGGKNSWRRIVVEFAAGHGWVTQAQIVKETNLKKRQVYAAMDGKDGGPVFERRKIPGAPHGEMEYRLAKAWGGITPKHSRQEGLQTDK